MKTRNIRTPLIYLGLLLAIVIMSTIFNPFAQPEGEELTYDQFLEKVRADDISAVKLISTELTGIYKNSQLAAEQLPDRYDFTVTIIDYDLLQHDLRAIAAEKTNKSVDVISTDDYSFAWESGTPPDFTLIEFIPYIILAGAFFFLWFILLRQQGGGSGISSFGKSKARMITSDTNKVTFGDVAGADEEKEELQEIVEFLKSPKKFTDIGARIPKGVLLFGPPGTGKTLLAKAVAGEAGVPFYSISGSDFVEMFVGVGASRVRDLFATAKKTAPAIVFIDEIDAVGRHRGAGMGGGHDEREQTLNQLLVEMDGFDPHAGIIVVAATNRPDILDPALLRPGRFDRQIVVNIPDVKGREEILRVHARKKPLGSDLDLKVVAQRTPGFTGADLENVLNEAAILAARRGKAKITMSEVLEAINRVIAGPEKKSRVISDDDKRITAYHETGHAVLARELKNCDEVHEISIIQRGRAAGYTVTLPEKEVNHLTRSKMIDEICMLLGGRAAEELFIGEICTGAYNDIQRATETARKMVIEYGMSKRIGTVFFGEDNEVFLGKSYGHTRGYSEEVAGIIDEEIKSIIDEAYERARSILDKDKDAVLKVAEKLIDEERMDGYKFLCVFNEAMGLEPPAKPELPLAAMPGSTTPESETQENGDDDKPDSGDQDPQVIIQSLLDE